MDFGISSTAIDGEFSVSCDARLWIGKMRRLAAKYPEQVRILHQPESNHGCLLARVPAAWVRVGPPPKREMTEEQRQAAAERMRKLVRDRKQD